MIAIAQNQSFNDGDVLIRNGFELRHKSSCFIYYFKRINVFFGIEFILCNRKFIVS